MTAADRKAVEKIARAIAEEEVAALCGLVLKRLGDSPPELRATSHEPLAIVASAFAEKLAEYRGDRAETQAPPA